MKLSRRLPKEVKMFEIECDYEIEITKFSDTLAKNRKVRVLKKVMRC